MLLGIDPLLHGHILSTLDSFGHTDVLLIADGNFPSSRVNATAHRVGATSLPALAAVLSVFPIDDSDGRGIAVRRSFEDSTLDDRQQEALALVSRFAPGISFDVPSRQEFRDRLSEVRALILTTDAAPSCFLIRKGIVESTRSGSETAETRN